MTNLLAHVTGESHAENNTILHWITSNKPLLAIFIFGLTLAVATAIAARKSTTNKDK